LATLSWHLIGRGSDCDLFIKKVIPFSTKANRDLLLVRVGLFLWYILIIRVRAEVLVGFVVRLLVLLVHLLLILGWWLIFFVLVVKEVLFVGHKIYFVNYYQHT